MKLACLWFSALRLTIITVYLGHSYLIFLSNGLAGHLILSDANWNKNRKLLADSWISLCYLFFEWQINQGKQLIRRMVLYRIHDDNFVWRRCLPALVCVDVQRIQQVVQQTSRLNQAMSSVMGAGGPSTRANISFGGFYDGFWWNGGSEQSIIIIKHKLPW